MIVWDPLDLPYSLEGKRILQRAIWSWGQSWFGSCFIPCDDWYHPTTTTKPYPQKLWFVLPFCSFTEAGCLIQLALLPPKVMDGAIPTKNCPARGLNKPFPSWTSMITSAAGCFWNFGTLVWQKPEQKSPEWLLYLWSLDLGLNLTHQWDRVEMQFSPQLHQQKPLHLTSTGSSLRLTALKITVPTLEWLTYCQYRRDKV